MPPRFCGIVEDLPANDRGLQALCETAGVTGAELGSHLTGAWAQLVRACSGYVAAILAWPICTQPLPFALPGDVSTRLCAAKSDLAREGLQNSFFGAQTLCHSSCERSEFAGTLAVRLLNCLSRRLLDLVGYFRLRA